MAIEIAGIRLPRVHRIVTVEQAALVYHRVPGKQGSAVQNLGRDSVQLRIEGIFYGPKAKESLEQLRAVHVKREPVDFVADVMGTAYAGKVTLDRLEVVQSASEPEQFSYSLAVSEYAPPPRATSASAAVNTKIAVNAKASLALAGLGDALSLGSIPEISNPFVPLKNALEPAKAATDALMKSTGGLSRLFGM